ncbi:hypothetical protein ACLBKS_05455 [Hylemonella sp. W303a]|uniref:hypothetical protein n=1 Tax=Hylemonella sp. W303a TaxID=3389873 RepID=UPI00396B3723
MLSRSSRSKKQGRNLQSAGVAQSDSKGKTLALERVRMAMSGAMQASLTRPAVPASSAGDAWDRAITAPVGSPRAEPVAHGAQVDEQVDLLERQLRTAPDLDTLWYLRPGLMNVIAVRQGEVAARDCLVALTALFKHTPSSGRSAHPGAF